ncbi:MAG: hypothetical protein H6541_06550 [Lentimicrobiaceae bacterium]|nr:hypothetical protein [Lentimicrobiaceae bacterium]MCB9023237.1 hypothetical protein [Lentimicrobiaceae bacterium]HPG33871.1 hypothetical protein [Lentimicrobium sp.]
MKLKNNLFITANSTAIYLLSYLFVFLIHQFFTIIACKIFSFPVELNYTTIIYWVYEYEWTFDSVKIIFSAGPVICFILSIFMLVVAIKFREYDGLLKSFFLWGFIHCINLFLGSALAGALLGEGFGHVLIWLFMADTGKMIITLIGFFGLAAVGFGITRLILLTANSYYNKQEPSERPAFLFYSTLLPFILGTLIIAAIRYPMNYYESLRLVTPVLIILPSFLNSNNFPVIYFDENHKVIKASSSLIAAAFIILIIYRVALSFPLKF